MEGWYQEGKWWQRLYTLSSMNGSSSETDVYNYDDIIRHVITEDNKDAGWFVKNEDNKWHTEPWIHIKTILEGPMGYSQKETKIILGSNVIKPWQIVNRPFEH